jgi:hypothetical protein
MNRWNRFNDDFAGAGVTLVMGLWIVLFTLGAHVSTTSHVAALASPASVLGFFASLATVVTCWTMSNVGMLCILSSWIGSRGSDESLGYVRAITKGGLIYFVILAFLVVAKQGDVAVSSQMRYVWLAGVSSAACFASSYNSQLFDQLIDGVAATATNMLTAFSRRANG